MSSDSEGGKPGHCSVFLHTCWEVHIHSLESNIPAANRWDNNQDQAMSTSMVFSSSTICIFSGAVVVEKTGDASKESKDAKTFFRAVRLSRRIIDNYSFHGDIETIWNIVRRIEQMQTDIEGEIRRTLEKNQGVYLLEPHIKKEVQKLSGSWRVQQKQPQILQCHCGGKDS